MRLHQFRYAVEDEVALWALAGVHRRAEAVPIVPAVNPAIRQPERLGLYMVVEQALGGVQDFLLRDTEPDHVGDHVVEITR